MSKSKNDLFGKFSAIEVISFVLSLFYFQSVLTVAHHTAYWVHDGTSRTVDAPSYWWAIASLVLVILSWTSKKRRYSTVSIITLTVLVVSSLFWLSGLRTNFYF